MTTPTMEAHQLPRECYPPTDSDDESFVVLETDCDSPPVVQPQEVKAVLLESAIVDEALTASESLLASLIVQELPAVPKMDLSVASMSAESTTTNDDLQQKVEMLLDENHKLSNSLNQNNIVMKTQFETLSKWQEDVERVHESHKKKFAETKEYIKMLQQENVRLKSLINSQSMISNASMISSQLHSAAASQMSDVSTSMVNVQETNDYKSLQAQLEATQNELKQQTDDSLQIRDELAKMKDKLAQYICNAAISAEELESTKQQLTQSQQALADKTAKANETREEMVELVEMTKLNLDACKQSFTDLQAKYAQSEAALQAERKQVDGVKQQLAHITNDLALKCAECIALQTELSNRSTGAPAADMQIRILKEEIRELSERAANQRVRLEQAALLDEQLADYKRQVHANDEETKRLQMESLEATKKEQKLLEDVAMLKCTVAKLRNAETAEMQHLQIQLVEAQKAVVEQREAKKAVEREAAENRQLVDSINQRLAESLHDKDRIVALEEQLNVYRGDYESERENKVRAVEELNKISSDLDAVQLRNRQLRDEVDELRRRADSASFETVPIPQTAAGEKPPSPPLTHYRCPLCGESFRSLRSVEEHVDMCINLTSPN